MDQTRHTLARAVANEDANEVASAEASAVVIPALSAILLGGFLVLGIGFAHSDTIHNAAHDSRHSFAFPCH